MKKKSILVLTICILWACVACCSAAVPLEAISAYNRGVDLAMEGQFDEALLSIDQALSLDQNFTLAWITKAGILNVKGEFNESLEASDRALALDETQADAWTNKASALISLQKFEGGARGCQQGHRTRPQALGGVDRQGNSPVGPRADRGGGRGHEDGDVPDRDAGDDPHKRRGNLACDHDDDCAPIPLAGPRCDRCRSPRVSEEPLGPQDTFFIFTILRG